MIITSLIVFLTGYVISMTYTSVFYHRALTHDALKISQKVKRFIELTGMPLIGLDPVGWVCMHRLHHEHSDTELDPHSPHTDGFFKLFWGQKKAYTNILNGLTNKDPYFTNIVSDLDMNIHWMSRLGLWWLPYILHLAIALLLTLTFNSWLLGQAYFWGIAGHAIQGWSVNSFGHSRGYRTFDSDDKSTNNTIIALLFFGEGYQNNHHHDPSKAKLSHFDYEVDPGFFFVRLLERFGIVQFNSKS